MPQILNPPIFPRRFTRGSCPSLPSWKKRRFWVEQVHAKRVSHCEKGLSSPNIAQNSFNDFSLNCNVLGPYSLCPSHTRGHFHFIFLNSPHKSIVCAGNFCGLSKDIFRNKLPKHAFLSHSPLAPPWRLSPDQIPGALNIFLFH